MPDYRYSEVSGTSWTRCHRLVIENPLEGTPAITFLESKIINLEDGRIEQNQGCLVTPFTSKNADTEFPLQHPETGEPLGTATYTTVYILLHSLYLFEAQKRDQGPQYENLIP